MSIILANRYFYPDQSATSRMLTSLAFGLAREGHEVTAVASRRLHDRLGILPALELVDGVRICRLAGSGFGRRTVIGRAADYATFHLAAARWLLANARPGDACVVCTDPPLLSVSAMPPLALRGAVSINWVMDLYPEVAIELGMLRGRSLTGGAALALRDWSSRRAAVNVCPTGAMAKYLMRRIGPDRVAVLPHWSEGEQIHPVERRENELRRQWGLGDKFVVGYSGNFGRAHEFDTLLDAAGILRRDERFRFLLVGDGQKRRYVEREIARRGLDNVLLKPLQPPALLAQSLSAADAHLVSLLPQLEYCVIPSKLYGVLAAGRPVLFVGDPGGEVAEAIAGAECGKTVAIGQAAALAEAIVALGEDPALHAAACLNARRLFESRYTRERGLSAWRDLLRHGPGKAAEAAERSWAQEPTR